MNETIYYTISKRDLEGFAYTVAKQASERVLEHFRKTQQGSVTRKKAAEILHVSVRTVDNLIRNGEIRATKKGARVLIPMSELGGYDINTPVEYIPPFC